MTAGDRCLGHVGGTAGEDDMLELEAVGGAVGEPDPSQRNSRLTSSYPLALRSAPNTVTGP